MVYILESFRNIYNKILSVRLELCGYFIKLIKLKKRLFLCEIVLVMCVFKKWYVLF